MRLPATTRTTCSRFLVCFLLLLCGNIENHLVVSTESSSSPSSKSSTWLIGKVGGGGTAAGGGGRVTTRRMEHSQTHVTPVGKEDDTITTAATAAVRSSTVGNDEETDDTDGGNESVSSLLLSDDDENYDKKRRATFIAETDLPTALGMFRLRAYRTPRDVNNPFVGREPCVIYAKDKPPFGGSGTDDDDDNSRGRGVPVRVHDQCVTSEVFGSQRCDCREQLHMALSYILEHGGVVIYLQQEGRGIGLANKVAAYSLQDEGFDTVDANLHLGLPEDCRQYTVVPSLLDDLRIRTIRLLTNNPRKVRRLTSLGVHVERTIPMVVPRTNPFNHRYLQTKQQRMAHSNFGHVLSQSSGTAFSSSSSSSGMSTSTSTTNNNDSSRSSSTMQQQE